MKFFLVSCAALLAASTAASARQTDDELKAENVRRARESLVSLNSQKVNQIVKANHTYSGVAVAVAQGDNPLQLFNPFAPDDYGTSEDSVVRDSVTGQANGLKIFSISF